MFFFLNSVFVVIWGQSGLFWKTSVNVTSFCEGFYLRLKRIFALKMKASPAEGNSSVLTCVVGLEGQLVHPPSVDSFLCIHHIILSLWANLFPLLTYSSHLFAFSDRAHFTPSSNKNGHLLCTTYFLIMQYLCLVQSWHIARGISPIAIIHYQTGFYNAGSEKRRVCHTWWLWPFRVLFLQVAFCWWGNSRPLDSVAPVKSVDFFFFLKWKMQM